MLTRRRKRRSHLVISLATFVCVYYSAVSFCTAVEHVQGQWSRLSHYHACLYFAVFPTLKSTEQNGGRILMNTLNCTLADVYSSSWPRLGTVASRPPVRNHIDPAQDHSFKRAECRMVVFTLIKRTGLWYHINSNLEFAWSQIKQFLAGTWKGTEVSTSCYRLSIWACGRAGSSKQQNHTPEHELTEVYFWSTQKWVDNITCLNSS